MLKEIYTQRQLKKRPRSEEHRRKLSEALKGRIPWNKGKTGIYSEETKRKMSEAHKGRILSEETRKKISEANKGKKSPMRGKHFSEETKRRMSESRKGEKHPLWGKYHSEETKRKMSETKKGKVPWNKGKINIYNDETKRKISEMARKRFSIPENNPNWKGGISFEPYTQDWTDDLKESIRKRDNYICQMCGISQEEENKKLDIHHIDYCKQNLNPENLITLCRKCHSKTNFNRNYWKNYFKIALEKN